jgi:hypothetical protein
MLPQSLLYNKDTATRNQNGGPSLTNGRLWPFLCYFRHRKRQEKGVDLLDKSRVDKPKAHPPTGIIGGCAFGLSTLRVNVQLSIVQF